jgi:hypothetical protein
VQSIAIVLALVGIASVVLLGTYQTAATVAVATPTPTAWRPTAAMIGAWQRRDALLIVASSGQARFAWRTDWCGPEVAPPCDMMQGDTILLGAKADLQLFGVDRDAPLTVQGRVTGVNATGLFDVGPIELQWEFPDLVVLRQAGRTVELCRPPREPNFCDVSV